MFFFYWLFVLLSMVSCHIVQRYATTARSNSHIPVLSLATKKGTALIVALACRENDVEVNRGINYTAINH